MAAKKSRRTYSKGKTTAKRSVRSVPKKRTKSLPIKAFQKSIGKKFQLNGEEKHDVLDKKSRAKGRREGL